jgi:hypothetical protein
MKTLKDIDSEFTNHYKGLLVIQEKVVEALKGYSFDLNKTEITDAIIARMDAFWAFHVHNTKQILNRETNVVAGDFFTETCLLYIQLYFKGKYEVKSEVNINKGKGNAIKPDISIWKDEQLLAVIEIKVSNGFKGKFIIDHLKNREVQILAVKPGVYFGVIAYWNFFDINSEDWGRKYIGLVNYGNVEKHSRTGASVEELLRILENSTKDL